MKKSVQARASFNIENVKPGEGLERCLVPAMFATATGDTFVSPTHTQSMYEQYAGRKKICRFEGGHNS